MSYYKTTRQEYLKVKKGGQEALDELISEVVASTLKDYVNTGVGAEEIKATAYEKGFLEAIEQKKKEIVELEERHKKEMDKAVKEASSAAFEEGRKSQKEYLTKKEKERIQNEIKKERIKKEKKGLSSDLLTCYINQMYTDLENINDAIKTTKALTVAICVAVLKDNFWKKGYDKRIPVFLEEVIQLENSLNVSKVDDICRFARKYVEQICE